MFPSDDAPKLGLPKADCPNPGAAFEASKALVFAGEGLAKLLAVELDPKAPNPVAGLNADVPNVDVGGLLADEGVDAAAPKRPAVPALAEGALRESSPPRESPPRKFPASVSMGVAGVIGAPCPLVLLPPPPAPAKPKPVWPNLEGAAANALNPPPDDPPKAFEDGAFVPADGAFPKVLVDPAFAPNALL